MTACEHCDSSTPHEHVDVAQAVSARRRTLAMWSGVRIVLLAVTAALLAGLAGIPGATEPWVVVLAGAVAWALATSAGVLAAGLAHRSRAGARPRSARAALAVGALVTAAATPLVALAVALLPVLDDAGDSPVLLASWTGLGWLGAALAAEVAGAVRLRAVLLAPGPDGERARAEAVRRAGPHARGHRDAAAVLGAVAAAAVFTAWTAALMALPALVVVLVPLHVVGAALVGRARFPSRSPAPAARLRG